VGVLFFILKATKLNLPSSLVAASCLTLLLGIIKELDDWRLGQSDMVQDMAANLLGVGIAVAIIVLVRRHI
jgi:VanZ family protein